VPSSGEIGIGAATGADARIVATIWYRGWLDGHVGHVSEELVAGNGRVRRFYERNGWIVQGPIDYPAVSDRGPISVPSRKYVKQVAASAGDAVSR
jgi:hypothetical protein